MEDFFNELLRRGGRLITRFQYDMLTQEGTKRCDSEIERNFWHYKYKVVALFLSGAHTTTAAESFCDAINISMEYQNKELGLKCVTIQSVHGLVISELMVKTKTYFFYN